MAEFLADHVKSSTLQLIVLSLTGIIAILGIAQWVVRGVEEERAREKSDAFERKTIEQATEILSLNQSLAESADALKQGQNQIRQQAETNEYINDLANSPKIIIEWMPGEKGGPWLMKLTNKSDIVFAKLSVDFYTSYKLFDEGGLIEGEQQTANGATESRNVRGEFLPGRTVILPVPTFPRTLNPENMRDYTAIHVETIIGIRPDGYLPVLDDYRHRIILNSNYDRKRDYNPVFTTAADVQPLLRHREVHFARTGPSYKIDKAD